jgi:hypothetical protein
MHRIETAAPWLAVLLFAAALVLFGVASSDFSHLRHPLALLGARGEPHALAFNVIGFVVPGLLLAWRATVWRSRQAGASWALRIGLQLLLLSALAFAAQGLLPLDPTHLLAPASRLHAIAWTAWWVAFVPGALLVAAASRRWGGAALALLVPALALAGAFALPAPIAQRLAFLAWFGWWWSSASRFRD